MKKFAKILICLILCVFAFGLAACGKKDSFVYPKSSEITYSNGGLAVRKGNYLYFVNGYQSASSIDANNVPKSFFVGSLMIAKLDGNGNLIKNADGVLNDEYYRTMSDKLCGFEATNLYIFGDYLFFASPCLENETDKNGGGLANERVVFYRVKLDNSSNVEKIYTSATTNSNLDYEFYSANNSTYLLIFEKGDSIDVDDETTDRLARINVGGKKIGKDETIETDINYSSSNTDSNASAIILPGNNAYGNVFYVKASTTNKVTSYALYKYNAVSNQKTTYYSNQKTFTLKAVADSYVFITQNEQYSTSSVDLLKSNFNENGSSFSTCITNLQNYDTDSLTIANDGTIFVLKGNAIYASFRAKELLKLPEEESAPKLLGVYNNLLYYYVSADESKTIKSLSYLQAYYGETDAQTLTTTIATLTGVDFDNFEFFADKFGLYLYFYKTVGSNDYLHRLLLDNNPNVSSEELVGVQLQEDIPTEEETNE